MRWGEVKEFLRPNGEKVVAFFFFFASSFFFTLYVMSPPTADFVALLVVPTSSVSYLYTCLLLSIPRKLGLMLLLITVVLMLTFFTGLI